MKKLFFLLIMTFVSIFINAQTESLIMNNAESYIGTIDDKTKIKVGFYSVFLDKANFSGTIILNIEKTKFL